jgi:hypothetical protein
MMELAQIAAQFGFPALIAVVIMIAYQQLVKQIIEVVKANTSVMTQLSACVEEQEGLSKNIEVKLHEHNSVIGERIGRLEQPITTIVETTKRIESKLDRHQGA